LSDADWCSHHDELGIGSKACPNCGKCICKGETAEDIEKGFQKKILEGTFVPSPQSQFDYICSSAVIQDIPVGIQQN
jgi:hypothetical protein